MVIFNSYVKLPEGISRSCGFPSFVSSGSRFSRDGVSLAVGAFDGECTLGCRALRVGSGWTVLRCDTKTMGVSENGLNVPHLTY